MVHITNPLNVFKGPDALRKFFDPDEQPPVPLVELPDKLNPFRQDGVRIYAKLLTQLPAQNVKALPAVNMLLHDASSAHKTVAEVSSGSTVTSLAIANRVLYGNEDTVAFVSNKAALDRVRELQFFGLGVQLYGGPTYTETTDPRGPVEWARGLNGEAIVNLGQYDNENNWRSHLRWTGPQVWRQLPEVGLFCMGMGSTGCITGAGRYLKAQKPSIRVLGVCNAEADIVPGPRERPMHETSPFPWKEVVDFTTTVTSEASYRLSMQLSREGIISGPSSGMALAGLFAFLGEQKERGTLNQLLDPSSRELSCVFICCDLPQKHMDTYFQKLSPEEFKPIGNKELFEVDQHVYSFRWEIDPCEAYHAIPSVINLVHRTSLVLRSPGEAANGNGHLATGAPLRYLDLRTTVDFDACHTEGAYNIPVPGLTANSISAFDFGQPQVLVDRCKALTSTVLDDGPLIAWLSTSAAPLLVLDYDGNTSRIVVAALRARGVEAYSFRDGFTGLVRYLKR